LNYKILTVLTAVIFAFAYLAFAQTDVLSSDLNGIAFDVIPKPATDLTTIDGKVRIELISGDIIQISGKPEVPVLLITVAVPPNSNPQVKLVQRVPGKSISGHFPLYVPHVSESEIPNIKNSFVENQVIGEYIMSSIGGVSVIRIPIYPANYNQSLNQVDLAQSVKIRVDFNADNSIKGGKPARLNRMGELVIINPDQVKNWSASSTASFTEPSWPKGYLYRFPIDREGMYRLRYEDFSGKGVKIPDGGIRTNQLRIFGNGGGMLSENPNDSAQLGLIECAIYIEDGGDGSFDPGDWLSFYGKGAGGWTHDNEGLWDYQVHPYSNDNFYWLNIDIGGNGLRMSPIEESPFAETTVRSAPVRIYYGPDNFIYGSSSFVGAGRRWYSHRFDGVSRFNYNIKLESVDNSKMAVMKCRLVSARSFNSPSPQMEFTFNSEAIDNFIPGSHSSQFGGIKSFDLDGNLLNSGFNSINFQQTNAGVTSMFDWLDFQYYSELNRSVIFESVPIDESVQYEFSIPDAIVYNISNHSDVRYLKSSSLTIEQNLNEIQRYAVLGTADYLSIPVRFEEYFPPEADVANLWAESSTANVILITPDEYWDVLEPFVDKFARKTPPMKAVRIRLSEIFNRYSGGLMDPVAIRNMLHFAQENWATPPNYVVFCGDGDYNYRDIGRPTSTNILPPFELESSGWATDDWYVDFNPDDTYILPEMIHGRFTANSAYEMESIINKSIEYVDNPEFGLWRNTITLVADDEKGESINNEKTHILQQEAHANHNLPASLDINKIYLMEYEATIGREKPKSGEDLVAAINKGTLLISYMGHGNPTLWAHEHVFVLSRDLPLIERSRRLALYVAFTCDWAYWDNATTLSFPEQLLTMRDGGAIGVIASTRLTYAGENNTLATNYFRSQFNDDHLTIGEALALAKHLSLRSRSTTYHLLGDPTLHLAIPRLKGSLNIPTPYPLKPLALTNIVGEMNGLNGETDQDFEGEFELLVKDTDIKKTYVIKFYNYNGDFIEEPVRYKTNGIDVYRGKFGVESGIINGNFIIPKDVTLKGDLGRIYAYFHNDEIDGIIAIDSVVTADQAASGDDNVAPGINVFFDHRGYREGDKIGKSPLLIVDVADSSGINLTGKMGHGISVSIDGGRQINLTEDFEYDLDSYQSGSLEHRIGPLANGMHEIEIVAWDSYNNIAIKFIEITTADDEGGLTLDHVLNWPNPFNSTTQLTFTIDRPVDYEIFIFTVDGRRIWEYRGRASQAGIVSDAMWNGRDRAGRQVGNGVYLFQVNAWDENGQRAESIGQIAYVR